VQNLVGIVCFVYSMDYFSASAISMLKILLPGIFGFVLLLKFICFVSARLVLINTLETLLKASKVEVDELKKQLRTVEATASEEINKLRNDLNVLVASRNASNLDLSTQSVESLCCFLQKCQDELSRSGRCSRVAPTCDTFWLWNVYDISAYERLTIEDLKLIGDFLGLSTLSKPKITLIGAIIKKYESIL
jgi:hypothetical protein